jgi:hypothetical protein
MNPERFRGSRSGRVVQVGAGDAAYWAYVPNPLPPRLDLDVEVFAHCSKQIGHSANWQVSAGRCRTRICLSDPSCAERPSLRHGFRAQEQISVIYTRMRADSFHMGET